MPRNYDIFTTRQSWTTDVMEGAIKALQTGEMIYKKATKELSVPISTRKRRNKETKTKGKGY